MSQKKSSTAICGFIPAELDINAARLQHQNILSKPVPANSTVAKII